MERRQAVRVPWMTEVECEELDTGARHVSAQLSDISLTGVFLYGVPVLSEGTRLRLRFTLPSLQMQVDAAVVHTTPAGGMGLTFQNLTPVHRVVIQELMRADAGDSPDEPREPADPQIGLWEDAAGSLETVQIRLPVMERDDPGTGGGSEEASAGSWPSALPPLEEERVESLVSEASVPEPSLPDPALEERVESAVSAPESSGLGEPELPEPGPDASEPAGLPAETEVEPDPLPQTAAPGEPEAGSPEGPGTPAPVEPSPPEPAAADAADEGIDDVWPPPLPPLPEQRPPKPPEASAGVPAPTGEPGSAGPALAAEPESAEAPAAPSPDEAPARATPPPGTAAAPPDAGGDAAPLPADAEEGAPARRPRVLIVDDHERTRIMLRGMIEGREKAFEVTEACDGEDCLRVLDAEGPFDLIFLDVDMPRLDGLGACRELRARGVRAPIIFLTGRSELGDFRAGRDAGADTYIKKPIVLGTLRSMLGLFTSGSLQRR